MDIAIAIFIAIALLIWWNIAKAKSAEKKEHKRIIAKMALDVQDILDKISFYKTTSARVNNCGKAIFLLDKAAEYEV